MTLTGAARESLQTYLDEITSRGPAEIVPMVLVDGELTAVEVDRPGCGLVRCPSGYQPGDTLLRGQWTSTDEDPVPCTVTEVGIVHEVGGPVLFTIPVAAGPGPAPGRIDQAGRYLQIVIPFPARIELTNS